jgi:class 3 adenylate cyclase/streptogramin lyase
MQRRTVRRGLGAVLFTDIVGSTAIAAEMGNARWSELVSRHHRLIRREVRRFGGHEQDTAGDGFFVTFERPVDAIRCAVASAEAVRALGIEIRAGVSFGQLELVEGKAGGLIVNTAARVMAVAGGGEVLVPASVRDLVPGTGISFADHGTHHLKGIEDELRLFRVTEIDGLAPTEPLDADDAAERRRAILPAGRRRTGLVAGLLAAAFVLAIIAFWATRSEAPIQPRRAATAERFVVEFDAETGHERQRIAYPDPGRPEVVRFATAMAAGQGAVWIEDPTAYFATVFRLDPRHREIRRILVGPTSSFSLSIASGFDAIWVSTDRLIRINPATDEKKTVLRMALPSGGSSETSLALDREHLWIGTAQGVLRRVAPTGEVTEERRVTDSIQLVAASEKGVWVVDQLAGIILRVDPVTLERVGDPAPFTGSVDSIEISGDYIWTLDFGTGLLTRRSILEDRAVRQVTVPARATALDVGLGAVWIAQEDGTITRVDPETLQTSTFARIEGSVRALGVDAARGSIWVDVRRT